MEASYMKYKPQLKGVGECKPWLSKGQSITCLTIHQILCLALRVKQLATY